MHAYIHAYIHTSTHAWAHACSFVNTYYAVSSDAHLSEAHAALRRVYRTGAAQLRSDDAMLDMQHAGTAR